eukprot:SAG31_NODE_4425_length_3246_cov_1.445186_2_plen_49_part_00
MALAAYLNPEQYDADFNQWFPVQGSDDLLTDASTGMAEIAVDRQVFWR